MAIHVFFTPSAKPDLREARDHYRGQSEELAEGFVECAQFAVSRIASGPGQFAIVCKNVQQCRCIDAVNTARISTQEGAS